MSTTFEFRDIRFSYGSNEVLHGVSAEIASSKITALFGPNGSGKTTLLKCLAGLTRPSAGNISINGRSSLSMEPKELSRNISYVPQEHSVSFGFTVEEVVLMGRTPHLGGFIGPSADDISAAGRAIGAIHLQDIAAKPYTNLSGGQRQLVLIARALAQDTPIIIMDEPTSALDFKNQLLLWNELRKLRESGKTILVCTHDPNHVMWFCDSVFVLQDGMLISTGDVKSLMTTELMQQLYGPICSVSNNAIIPINSPCR